VNAIKLNACNDKNGNPRRVFVVLNDERVVEAIDEGYDGNSDLTRKYPGVNVVFYAEISPREYRSLLKDYGK